MQVDDEELLHPGHMAPDFTLPGHDGRDYTLSAYRGQWVFLFFFPKDDTFGCTEQTCPIRDYFDEFRRLNACIFGVSADSSENHRRLAEKYRLPFVLLSDSHHRVAARYDAMVKDQILIKSTEIARVSFLIDIMGEIEKVYRNVEPKIHARDVLRDLLDIQKREDG